MFYIFTQNQNNCPFSCTKMTGLFSLLESCQETTSHTKSAWKILTSATTGGHSGEVLPFTLTKLGEGTAWWHQDVHKGTRKRYLYKTTWNNARRSTFQTLKSYANTKTWLLNSFKSQRGIQEWYMSKKHVISSSQWGPDIVLWRPSQRWIGSNKKGQITNAPQLGWFAQKFCWREKRQPPEYCILYASLFEMTKL